MLILNNAFHFQVSGLQSSNHNICFLMILANGYLGHGAALGPVQRLFCLVLTFRGVRSGRSKAVPRAWQAAPAPF